MMAFANAGLGIMTTSQSHRMLFQRFFAVLVLLQAASLACHAQDPAEEKEEARKTPIGQFVTIGATVDDVVYAKVSSAAIKLQGLAVQEGRPAFLVLQVEPGTSQFHHVQGLAKFLTSAQIKNVTTVAWVPETVTGVNVLVALACRQIVMHPDAELGDIGRGKPLDPDDRQGVLAIAQKRHNPKVNAAIVRAMMDPSEQLWRIRVRSTNGGKEELDTRVVTKDELEVLAKTNVEFQSDVVKEAGLPGQFRGATARELDILVVQTANSKSAVGDLYALPREAQREQSGEKEARKVRLIRVDGMIDPVQETFLERQIQRAVSSGAQVIVFEIDSPGGYLHSSENLAEAIMQLEERKVRTIAYVPHGAFSGAAIIALGCDEIIMHPDARLGDAGPIEVRDGEVFERAPEKILSPLRIKLGEIARRKHRPEALCMAMADRSLKVFQVTHRDNGRIWYMTEHEIASSAGEWIIGPQVPETLSGENLFTVNGVRAHEVKLAEAPVQDIIELKGRIGLPASAELRPIEKTWVDHLVHSLNRPGFTVMLLVLAMVLIYIELQLMTGILGILSVLCFAIFFWSRFLGGTAGWLEVVLFILGLSFLGLEIFVIPGFGVFGISGIALILASLVMAGHTWTFDSFTNAHQLAVQTGWVLLSFGCVGVFGICAARFLPQVPMFESMVLGPPGVAGGEAQLRLESIGGESNGLVPIGQQGISRTMLRPAGKAEFDNRLVDVVSDGPFILPDVSIEVVSVTGNRIVVRQASSIS